LNVHLTVLHPYRLNQLEKKEDMVAVKKRLDLDAAQNFERIGQGLFNGQKVSVDFRSEVGFIPDRVQDFARRNNILLLVIGVDLAMGTKEGLEEIVKEIEVPLVIIPCAHAKHAANNPAE
jgi:nucleotide-binding universal stress UspA family protein